MKFDELEAKMRVFETAYDYCVLPGIYMVARIDGRSFTRLTKEVHKFDAPYDERMRDFMIATVEHLMQCGFDVIYGYTQSDEISLLFHPQITAFNRKIRKYNSILAGEASAKFSLLLGDLAAFDCRICELPTIELVSDYFRWRSEDAHRNALNGHCYWLLRRQNRSVGEATSYLERLSIAEKNELLFTNGINFNDLPNWQKRGVGLLWQQYEKEGMNPVTGQTVKAIRRGIKVEMNLPMKDEYSEFIKQLLADTVVST
ncbi:MAG: tRNA(His) guanylyltransferase Thg1 family protein [Acidobacteriota bacterium]